MDQQSYRVDPRGIPGAKGHQVGGPVSASSRNLSSHYQGQKKPLSSVDRYDSCENEGNMQSQPGQIDSSSRAGPNSQFLSSGLSQVQ